jgi:hypothetical protein
MAIDRRYQRDEAVGGKENMPHALAGSAEHIAKSKLDALAVGKQLLTILTRESREQLIFRRALQWL